jgi:hypothetical protein
MKTLSGSSFFRLFDLLLGETDRAQNSVEWLIDDVRFVRERHSYSGRSHCFAVDVFTLSRPGRHRWALMVVKEYWWDGGHKRSIRTQAWSRPIEGRRRDIMAWLREKEAAHAG